MPSLPQFPIFTTTTFYDVLQRQPVESFGLGANERLLGKSSMRFDFSNSGNANNSDTKDIDIPLGCHFISVAILAFQFNFVSGDDHNINTIRADSYVYEVLANRAKIACAIAFRDKNGDDRLIVKVISGVEFYGTA